MAKLEKLKVKSNSIALHETSDSRCPNGLAAGFQTLTAPCSVNFLDNNNIEVTHEPHASLKNGKDPTYIGFTINHTDTSDESKVYPAIVSYRYVTVGDTSGKKYKYVTVELDGVSKKFPITFTLPNAGKISNVNDTINSKKTDVLFAGKLTTGEGLSNTRTADSYSAPMATGFATSAVAKGSHAGGYLSQAWGAASLGHGYNVQALGDAAAAFGAVTTAKGDRSMASGVGTQALGLASLAVGYPEKDQDGVMVNPTKAVGYYSQALGQGTESHGISSLASGFKTRAIGDRSQAFGIETTTCGRKGFNIGKYIKNSVFIPRNSKTAPNLGDPIANVDDVSTATNKIGTFSRTNDLIFKDRYCFGYYFNMSGEIFAELLQSRITPDGGFKSDLLLKAAIGQNYSIYVKLSEDQLDFTGYANDDALYEHVTATFTKIAENGTAKADPKGNTASGNNYGYAYFDLLNFKEPNITKHFRLDSEVVKDKTYYLYVFFADPTKDSGYGPSINLSHCEMSLYFGTFKDCFYPYNLGDICEIYLSNDDHKIHRGKLVGIQYNNQTSGIDTNVADKINLIFDCDLPTDGTGGKVSSINKPDIGDISFGAGQFAEGHDTTASGAYSHAEGDGTIANSAAQHVQGRFNIADDSEIGYAHIVGNGTSSTERSNAYTLDWNGNAEYAGDVKASTITIGSTTITEEQLKTLLTLLEYTEYTGGTV